MPELLTAAAILSPLLAVLLVACLMVGKRADESAGDEGSVRCVDGGRIQPMPYDRGGDE